MSVSPYISANRRQRHCGETIVCMVVSYKRGLSGVLSRTAERVECETKCRKIKRMSKVGTETGKLENE